MGEQLRKTGKPTTDAIKLPTIGNCVWGGTYSLGKFISHCNNVSSKLRTLHVTKTRFIMGADDRFDTPVFRKWLSLQL